MNLTTRTRIFLSLLVASMVCSAAWAGPAADARNSEGPVTVSGAYIVNFSVSVGSAVPAGSTISCKAKIAPKLPGFQNRGPVPVLAAAGVGTVTGNSLANCSVEIPFAWTVSDGQSGVALSYEVDAVSGGTPVAVRTQEGIAAAYPAQGGAASLRFNLAF